MPTDYPYDVPVVYTPEDNDTRITKKVYTFKNCGQWGLDDGCSGWNFNKCPNDDDYCQPYVVGDKLYMQYLIPATWTGFAAIQMIDNNGEVVAHGASMVTQIGKDAEGLRYVNIIIDTALLPGVTCFYFKLTFWDCKQFVTPNANFAACVALRLIAGDTLAEAIIHCGNLACDSDNQKIVYSEPYCEVRCDEPTVLIEGEYSKYDCENYYYGELINLVNLSAIVNQYLLKFRVRGFLELDDYETTETEVNGVVTKVSQKKKFTFYTDKVPPFVAEQLARAAGSKQFIMDDVDYDRPANITKDFDQGLSWIPKLVLTKKCDDIDLTCE